MEENNKVLIKILNMSKLIFATLLLIFIILVIGVSKMYSTGENDMNNNTESEYNTVYDVSMFEEINAKDIKSKTKKDIKLIYIGRESCGWCAAFLPNLWNAQEDYDFTTLYIDIAKIIDFETGAVTDQKSFDILNNLTGKGYESYMNENLGATPMILIMKNNKIIKATTGYYEYEELENILKDFEF